MPIARSQREYVGCVDDLQPYFGTPWTRVMAIARRQSRSGSGGGGSRTECTTSEDCARAGFRLVFGREIMDRLERSGTARKPRPWNPGCRQTLRSEPELLGKAKECR